MESHGVFVEILKIKVQDIPEEIFANYVTVLGRFCCSREGRIPEAIFRWIHGGILEGVLARFIGELWHSHYGFIEAICGRNPRGILGGPPDEIPVGTSRRYPWEMGKIRSGNYRRNLSNILWQNLQNCFWIKFK